MAAGYVGHLEPIDAFWGNRYAEVDDADGNLVGFHNPPEYRAHGPGSSRSGV